MIPRKKGRRELKEGVLSLHPSEKWDAESISNTS